MGRLIVGDPSLVRARGASAVRRTAVACLVGGLVAATAIGGQVITVPAVAAVAGAPTDAAGSPGDAQVFVSWVAPVSTGGSAITGYRVQVSTSAGSGFADAAGGCRPAAVTVSTLVRCDATGLSNGTPYYFKVAAVNADGTGSYSTASAAVTPAVATNRVVTLNSGGGVSASDGLKFDYGAGQYQVTRYNSATTPPASAGQLYGDTETATAPWPNVMLFNGIWLRVGSVIVGPCIPSRRIAVTGASGNGTTVTYTTASDHGLSVGGGVLVSGTDPAAYETPSTAPANGALVTAVPSPTSFSIASTATGTYNFGGAATTGTMSPASCAVGPTASLPITAMSAWTSVVSSGGSSNSVAGGSGTAKSTLTYVDPATSLTYTLVLRFDYTAGDPFVTQTATLTVPTGSASEVKLYQAMDTYLGGSDRGAGFRTLDSSSNVILVGVRSTSGTTEGLRWRSGDQWTGYVSSLYTCPFRSNGCSSATPSDGTGSIAAGGDFWTGATAIDASPTVDNGIGVMWNTTDSPGTTTYSWDVLFAVAPVISTASLPATDTCATYSQTLAATSGSGTYNDWQIATGSLPTGMTLNSATGVISGTSSAIATSPFSVTVTDSNYFTSEPQALSIAVSQGMPVVSTASLAGGVVSTAYSQTLAATCGTGIYSSWALTSGSLPAGLTLNTATGVISGTPTTAQVAPITVEVTDSGGNVATRALSITVTAPVPSAPSGSTPATAPASTPASVVPCTLTTQAPITNPVNGNIPVGGVSAGATVMLNGCAAVPTTLTPDGRSLTVSTSGFMMRLEGRGDVNDPLGLAGNSILQLVSGPAGTSEIQSRALVSGTGALPGTTVKVYLLTDIYLGELPVDAAGTFNGSVDIPPGLAPGTYTLQANALGTSRQTRSLSIGVLVKSSKSVRIPSGRATVRFAKDSAKLTVRAKRELRALAHRIGPTKAHSVVLGYVQRDGTRSDNKELSTARARKAATFLRSIGMRGVVVARGRGVDAEKPGPRGRRVDVSIVGLPR